MGLELLLILLPISIVLFLLAKKNALRWLIISNDWYDRLKEPQRFGFMFLLVFLAMCISLSLSFLFFKLFEVFSVVTFGWITFVMMTFVWRVMGVIIRDVMPKEKLKKLRAKR